MKHALEALLAGGLASVAASSPKAFRRGAAIGDLARAVGLRRSVAEANLARAFPERSAEERRAILEDHYRELGRVAWEYPRLGRLVRAPEGEVVASLTGLEHVEAAGAAGRGLILLTGHFSNFELFGARIGRLHPMSFVVKPMSNPRVDAMVAGWRREAGVGSISIGAGVRRIFEELRENRWIAMVADQDARRSGVFVPFFGIPTSTPAGPAAIALRSGAPIVMGFATRRADGRFDMTFRPALPLPAGNGAESVRALTAAHAAELERWVRRHPAMWFWLHRRWKTCPPAEKQA